MAEKRERAPKTRLSAEKRERFLEVLGQTGNRKTAADAIGVDARLMDQRREFDPLLNREWEEALAQADRRLAGSAGPLDCSGGGGANVIRRGTGGRLQVVTAKGKRWTRAVENRFLAVLGVCGNMAAAARAVGFTASCVWQRRAKYPDFADKIEAMLDEAEVALELRLAAQASGSTRLDAEDAGALAADVREVGDGFDPDLAFRFLKWREEKRRTGKAPSRGGRPEKVWTFDESIQLLEKRLKAFGERREMEKRKAGWSKDTDGNLIPPGWVREAGAEGAEALPPPVGEGLGENGAWLIERD